MRLAALLVAFTICAAHGAPRHRNMLMEATAFARAPQPTAAGTRPHDGIVAADPTVLPLGTRIRVTGAGAYNGAYIVTDTGSAVKGRHIDIYVPSTAQAKRFGKKTVRVRIVETGEGKTDAREKDTASVRRPRTR